MRRGLGARLIPLPVACNQAQTARALGRKFKPRAELLPGGTVEDLLELAQWPKSRGAVLVVGHQPMLGETAAKLLGMTASQCAIRKGSVWWLRHRSRQEIEETILLSVQSPDFL